MWGVVAVGCRIAAWLLLVPGWTGASSVAGKCVRAGDGVGGAGCMICVGMGGRGKGGVSCPPFEDGALYSLPPF